MTSHVVRPTLPTRIALLGALLAIAGTSAFLLARYPALPDILPVRFGRGGFPIGWQYKTMARVLMPVYVQLALLAVLGSVGALVLSRPHGRQDVDAPDVRAAATAAEAVTLLAAIWIGFQGYAAVALAAMWQAGRDGLGPMYTVLEVSGVVISVVIFARAQMLWGKPGPRPYVAEHWRFGQLYKNPMDPALFVPTRDGRRWTLNFGRPIAAALMGVILAVGIVGPMLILGLLLR
jgi:uncharacterized membrane protein